MTIKKKWTASEERAQHNTPSDQEGITFAIRWLIAVLIAAVIIGSVLIFNYSRRKIIDKVNKVPEKELSL